MTGTNEHIASYGDHTKTKMFLLPAIGFIVFFLNIALGSVYISMGDLYDILTGAAGTDPTLTNIVVNVRLPQAVTALLAGAALGAGGLMMQTLFRNPLAGPSVLGVSSGASLGVAVMILFAGVSVGNVSRFSGLAGNMPVVLSAIAGAILVLVLIGMLAARFKSNTVVLVMGIMIAYAVSAVVGVLQFYSMKEDLQTYVMWGLGSFANVSLGQLPWFSSVIVAGLGVTFLLTKPLNALLLGENYARNLGVNIRTVRMLVIFVTGLLTAVVTAYCGPIAFLGLAVPHISRNFFRSADHLINIPGVIFIGGVLALVCNLLARLPGYEGALPVNSITSIIGAPVVIWIIIRRTEFSTES